MEYEIINTLDAIIYRRPLPNREFDQIYMLASNMFTQAKYIAEFIKEKNIVFLGDGDGMSILLSALSTKNIISKICSMGVYDFDERILLNIEKQIKNLHISEISYEYGLYNVIMPVAKENINKYNFFYINPPYGSKNEGLSCQIWIDRCLDFCDTQCSGCIIIPYDHKLPWSVKNMYNVQSYLLRKGFVIRDMVSYMHQYHLDDNPELQSAALIVERIFGGEAEYSNEYLAPHLVKNLYGSPKKIPKYIYACNEDIYGRKDYSWKYGKDEFWNK